RQSIHSSPRRNRREKLFNTLTTALNQNDQHNHRKDCGNHADECYIVHFYSPFLMSEVLVKTFHYGDGRRTQSYQKERRKDKQHKRKDQFNCRLSCLLLHFLATLCSEGVGMNS